MAQGSYKDLYQLRVCLETYIYDSQGKWFSNEQFCLHHWLPIGFPVHALKSAYFPEFPFSI